MVMPLSVLSSWKGGTYITLYLFIFIFLGESRIFFILQYYHNYQYNFSLFLDLEKFCPQNTGRKNKKNAGSHHENNTDNSDVSTGGINVYVHHGGDKETRTENFLNWRKKIKKKSNRGNESFNNGYENSKKENWSVSIVLTTYDLAIRDLALLRKQSIGADR